MAVASTPKFEVIKRQLIADIESGMLPPGSRIASETELMEQHGVARMTVVRSLNEMVAKGFLVRVKGKGTFVKVPRASEGDLRRLQMFALVVPEMLSGFYPSLIKSFSDASGQRNHQMITCNTDNNVERQGNTILRLIDSRVTGVAMVPATHGEPPAYHVRQLQKNGIPVVLLHREVVGVTAPLIKLDHEKAGCIAGDALVAAGHRRVAMFGTHASSVTAAYADGLRRALRRASSDLPADLVHYGKRYVGDDYSPDHEAGVEASLRRMLDMPTDTRPTAIFSTWEPDAELIYLTLERIGVSVPRDVSLLSVGGVLRLGAFGRKITAVTADEEYAGRLAAKLLEEMSSGVRPITDQYEERVPLGISDGASLRKLVR